MECMNTFSKQTSFWGFPFRTTLASQLSAGTTPRRPSPPSSGRRRRSRRSCRGRRRLGRSLTDLVAIGSQTSSLRSHPDNVLASPLCHSSHQSTPSGVGRFPSRNVATVENSRYASRKLNELRIRFEKHDRREQALQRSADGGALTRKPGVLDTPISSTLTTMSLLVAAASA